MILYSNILGEGNNHLIILHGFLGIGDNWKSQAKIFANNFFKVHLVDQRNHGRSFWSNNFNYDLLADDLKFYMDHHNIHKAIIMGHSMGGKTAMNFSFKYPKRVEKLIIIDISPKKYKSKHDMILSGLSSLNFEIIKSRKQADDHLSHFVSEPNIRNFLLKNLYWKSPDRLSLRFNISILKNSSIELNKEIKLSGIFDKPTLFLKGEFSDYISTKDIELIKKYFIKYSVLEVKESGHWVHVDNQKDFFKKINNFLNYNILL